MRLFYSAHAPAFPCFHKVSHAARGIWMRQTTRYGALMIVAAAAIGAAPSVVHATSWCAAAEEDVGHATEELSESVQDAASREPRPRAVVHSEGTPPDSQSRALAIVARRDLQVMRDAALLWHQTHDSEALVQAKRYLLAWIETYQPSFNPIDETNFDELFETYGIIRPVLSQREVSRIDSFLRHWGANYVDLIEAAGDEVTRIDKIGRWNSNWQSHRIKIVTMIAAATDDDALFAHARRLFRQQVGINIDGETGEVLDFRQRDAVHYVVYNIQPLLQASVAARLMGENWYNWTAGNGSSVALAMEWLRPYALGDITHEEFVGSSVAFDARRARAGELGYSGTFNPKRGADIYWYAAIFDQSFEDIAHQLRPSEPLELAFCGR